MLTPVEQNRRDSRRLIPAERTLLLANWSPKNLCHPIVLNYSKNGLQLMFWPSADIYAGSLISFTGPGSYASGNVAWCLHMAEFSVAGIHLDCDVKYVPVASGRLACAPCVSWLTDGHRSGSNPPQ
jgi:hypothetical protein